MPSYKKMMGKIQSPIEEQQYILIVSLCQGYIWSESHHSINTNMPSSKLSHIMGKTQSPIEDDTANNSLAIYSHCVNVKF